MSRLAAQFCRMRAQVHERADSFRAQISALEMICHIYNNIQHTVLPVEKPLVQAKLDSVDTVLQSGLAVSHQTT